MSRQLIGLIKLEMFFAEGEWNDGGGQVLMLLFCSALAPARFEFGNRDAHGNAGIAVLAMWSVCEFPATPEAELNKAAVRMGVYQVVRGSDQGLRQPSCQVPASVWRGGIELDFLQGRIVGMCHDQ